MQRVAAGCVERGEGGRNAWRIQWGLLRRVQPYGAKPRSAAPHLRPLHTPARPDRHRLRRRDQHACRLPLRRDYSGEPERRHMLLERRYHSRRRNEWFLCHPRRRHGPSRTRRRVAIGLHRGAVRRGSCLLGRGFGVDAVRSLAVRRLAHQRDRRAMRAANGPDDRIVALGVPRLDSATRWRLLLRRPLLPKLCASPLPPPTPPTHPTASKVVLFSSQSPSAHCPELTPPSTSPDAACFSCAPTGMECRSRLGPLFQPDSVLLVTPGQH